MTDHGRAASAYGFAEACRTFSSACLFFCLAGAVCLAPGSGHAGDGYLGELQRQAGERGLAEERTWEVLLHYKPAGAGVRSLVDDPRFFNAPDGRENPRAELSATLASFFQTDVKAEAEHPRCRFIARYTWLRERLGIEERRLPPADCSRFETALASVNPRSVVLVFPNTLLNQPSSLFGHTLLRINTRYESDLLSHAVNYSAITAGDAGFWYAVKGLFGLLPGRYSNLPYYAKVREYSDLEHRDIWEYHLNLTPDEAYRLFLHVWEMKDFYEYYSFFDRNCSFNILFLIEAGRPSLRLTDKFFGGYRFWVIPVDTIRAAQKAGIVDRVTYRPSRATKILRIAEEMDRGLLKMASDVVDEKRTPESVLAEGLGVTDTRKVLDLSAELAQYRFSTGALGQEQYEKLFLTVLAARSTLGAPPADPYPVAMPVPPDQGHLSARVRTGAGYRSNAWFGEFEWRGAYHDITDHDEGYVRGAQINFLELSLRYYGEEDPGLRLHRLRLVDILSLSPWNGIFKEVSWKINFGAEETMLAGGADHPVVRLNGGGGAAVGMGSAAIAYLLADADLLAGARLEEGYALGFGGTGGVMVNLTRDWKMNFRAQGLFYGAGDRHQHVTGTLQNNVRLTTNAGLSLDAMRERAFGVYKTDVVLRGNWYY